MYVSVLTAPKETGEKAKEKVEKSTLGIITAGQQSSFIGHQGAESPFRYNRCKLHVMWFARRPLRDGKMFL